MKRLRSRFHWNSGGWKRLPFSVNRGMIEYCLLALGLAMITLIIGLWLPPEELVSPENKAPLSVLDRTGQTLALVRDPHHGREEPLKRSELPTHAIDAVLSIEDRQFYSHPGVSIRGIARALVDNWKAGRIVSGGSTITQQLVRIRLQPERRTIFWKLREAYDALRLELALSKDDILLSYLNSAYFGEQSYGIQAAARTYFGKSAKELSLHETTLLIGLIQSPIGLNPLRAPERAEERAALVLKRMRDDEKITEEQETEALGSPLSYGGTSPALHAPHFVFWVLQNHPELLHQDDPVKTTLDLSLQREVERIIDRRLEKLTEHNVTSAAVVVLDAHTGEILSMVGSADYNDIEHDGAVNVAISPRQPGSTMKAFTYALALSQGGTPATTVEDIEARFFTQEGTPYVPRNYDFREHGLVRYREALGNSYNIAAVKVAERVGVERLLSFVREAGITTLTQDASHYGLALTLGDGEVTLLELATAYGLFARGGSTLCARALVSDAPCLSKQLLDPRVAWLISDILSDERARLPQFALGGPLSFPFPVAAKTGTTRNGRDNWTIAFTPDRVVGVWVGNADNTPMHDITGITGAAPILHDVMLATERDLPEKTFAKPSGIVEKEVCHLSGKLPTDLCNDRIIEHFIAGTEPRTQDDLWKSLTLDRRNGLLASDSCPSEFIEKRTFAVFPTSLSRWARDEGWPDPPHEFSPLCPRTSEPGSPTGELRISHPRNGDVFELDPLVPDEFEKLLLEAEGLVTSVEWFINDTSIGMGSAPDFRLDWQPEPGSWTLRAQSGNESDVVRFSVRRKGESAQ